MKESERALTTINYGGLMGGVNMSDFNVLEQCLISAKLRSSLNESCFSNYGNYKCAKIIITNHSLFTHLEQALSYLLLS